MIQQDARENLVSPWLFRAGLLALVLLVVAEGAPLLHLPYEHRADQDLVLAYNALLLNDGLPQEFFAHPGYAYILLLTAWFKLLHFVGLLPVHRFSALPTLADPAAFVLAWQQIVEAGRMLSIAIMAVFVVVFASLTAKLFDRRIGFLAGLALATAAGTVAQIFILRTELLSSLCAVVATLLVALAASGRTRTGLVALGAGGFLAVISVLSKVFGFLPLTIAPVVALLFGPPAPPAQVREPRRARYVALLAIVAIILAIPATVLVWRGLANVAESTYPYHPLGVGPLRHYQLLFLLWVFGGVALCAARWRTPPLQAIAGVGAIVLGTSLGVLVLLVRPELQNAIAATHPLEHMFVFSVWSDNALDKQPTVLSGAIFAKLAVAARDVVMMRFSRPAGDNLYVFEWFAAVGLLFGLRDRDRRWMLQAGLFLLLSLALQTVFLLRYDAKFYHVYSDAFTILAAAVVLDRFRWILTTRIGVVAVVIVMAYGGIWGIRYSEKLSHGPRFDPAEICAAQDEYLRRLETFPFCDE